MACLYIRKMDSKGGCVWGNLEYRQYILETVSLWEFFDGFFHREKKSRRFSCRHAAEMYGAIMDDTSMWILDSKFGVSTPSRLGCPYP